MYRAFHAVGDLRTSGGQPTGAVFGVVRMLARLRRRWPPEKVACIMDARGPTFRHKMYPQYKAHRPPMDPDLAAQIPLAKEFIRAAGWPLLCVEGVEADDVIASLARLGKAAGMEVVIASGDKDLMQLVGGGTLLYDSASDKTYDAEGVRDKFSVPPEAVADYLALVGDASDNIRGVEKVGPKTAAKWLAQHGTLDAIVAAAETFPGKVGENLRAAVANGGLALARALVALREDVAPEGGLESLAPRAPDAKEWRRLCDECEFREFSSALETAPAKAKPQQEDGRAKAVTVRDVATLTKMLEQSRKSGALAIDTETVGAPAMQAEIVGFSFTADGKTAAYVPLAHSESAAEGEQLTVTQAVAALRPFLEDAKLRKIAHNGKYDIHIFARCGARINGIFDDTKIAAYIAEPGLQTSMPALAKRHLKMEKIVFGDLVDKKTAKDFSEVNVDAATRYAAEDAEAAWRLQKILSAKMDSAARRLYETMDRPLMPLLAKMERTGVRINSEELSALAKDMHARMETLEKEAEEAAGHSFNLNSPRQLEKVLFDEMRAQPKRKTAGGKARSTSEEVLESLAADYPLAKIALEHRSLAKLSGTYADALPRAVHPQTGRVHSEFNQTSAATGRIASSSPNLQNIPVRTAEGRRIRRAFVAEKGMLLASADYSQIELRLMAHFSGDENLRAAFARGEDIHRRTAAEVFHLQAEEVDSEQRRAAKAINFGLIYGMSAFGLAQTLHIPQERARHYMDRYFSRYPGVAEYMENIRAQAAQNGYVETVFGRRLPAGRGAGRAQAAAGRAAINAPMQGSAADLIKMAMLAADEWLQKNKMQTRMILQVYDELLLEVAAGEEAEVRARLPELMCAQGESLAVPLAVDVRLGENWDAVS